MLEYRETNTKNMFKQNRFIFQESVPAPQVEPEKMSLEENVDYRLEEAETDRMRVNLTENLNKLKSLIDEKITTLKSGLENDDFPTQKQYSMEAIADYQKEIDNINSSLATLNDLNQIPDPQNRAMTIKNEFTIILPLMKKYIKEVGDQDISKTPLNIAARLDTTEFDETAKKDPPDIDATLAF